MIWHAAQRTVRHVIDHANLHLRLHARSDVSHSLLIMWRPVAQLCPHICRVHTIAHNQPGNDAPWAQPECVTLADCERARTRIVSYVLTQPRIAHHDQHSQGIQLTDQATSLSGRAAALCSGSRLPQQMQLATHDTEAIAYSHIRFNSSQS